MYTIMSSVNNSSFAFSCAIWMPFLSFSYLIALAKTSNTMLNRSVENRHPCLVLDLSGKALKFCSLSMMLAVGLSYMAFIMMRNATSTPTLLSVLIMNGCCTLSNAFSASIARTFVFSFLYVIYCVYWFANIVPSFHPWNESHWITMYDMFNVLLDGVCEYFVEDFSIMFINDIGLKFSFFVMSLSGFGIRMMLAS